LAVQSRDLRGLFDILPAASRFSPTSSPNAADHEVELAIYTSRVWAVSTSGKETNTIVLSEQAGANDLFFGEFGEGEGYDKYVEIYNGTGSAIDLSQYLLAAQMYGDGEYPDYGDPWERFCLLSPTTRYLEHGQTIVIVNGGGPSGQKADPAMTNALDRERGGLC
jgi:hypothetical protein